jgi:hypothetical protein
VRVLAEKISTRSVLVGGAGLSSREPNEEEGVDARCYDCCHTRVSEGDEGSGMRGWSITSVSRPSVLLYLTWGISSPKRSA